MTVFGTRPGALAAAMLALGIAGSSLAQPCRQAACAMALPSDAGAVNVRDFGAKGDGKTDDTAALLAAATVSGADTGDKWWHDRIVYLPAGTYLVSGSIVKRYADGRFGSGLALFGDGPDRTTIRLADHAAGFQDAAAPRGVVMTTSKRLDTGGSRDYVGKGEGNDAYENFVENLTVDVGAGNPGAIGIDYLANNLGAIRNVSVQAQPGSGAIGIAMLRAVPGPALIQSTEISGFATGVALNRSEYGITMVDVALRDQGQNGLTNDGNVLSAERLTIDRPGGSGLINSGPDGLVTLVDATIGSTIANRGTIVFRGTTASLPNAKAPAKLDGELRGSNTYKPSILGWSIPRTTIATVDPGPAEKWVGVSGATEEKPVDTTQALQRAMNSGARTVYLRHGTFWISATVHVPASVHRIVGMNSTLRVFPARQPGFDHDAPMFLVAPASDALQVDHLGMDNSNLGGQLGFRLEADRPLLMRDILSAGVVMLDRGRQGGPVALEDVCCGPLQVAGPAPVTARQFNTEGGGVRIENKGAKLSILGLKTEQESTVVSTSNGGSTEILGGLVYLVQAPSPDAPPIFVSHESRLAASFVEEVLQIGHGYRVYLRTEENGRVSQVEPTAMPGRGYGRMVGLLSTGSR